MLIELLVTILAGMVILGALFTIESTTLHQTTRAFSKVDATQHARVGIEQLENELHSACVTDDVTPILPGSTSSTLMFVSQYGSGATLTPVEHIVTYNAAAGTVTDATYQETGVTQNANGSPVYTFANSPSNTRTVLTNVTQSLDQNGNQIPVFQYFSYQEPMNGASPYTAPDGNPYMMLIDGISEIPGTSIVPKAEPLNVPLSTTDASNAAEVLISISVGPVGGQNENTGKGGSSAYGNFSDVNDSVSDGVVLRLTPAANELSNGSVFLPCQ